MCKDSQSGMSDALAGDVSLNLCLVDPVDTDPNKCPSYGYGPKSVSPQRVCVKACETEKERSLNFSVKLKVKVFQVLLVTTVIISSFVQGLVLPLRYSRRELF